MPVSAHRREEKLSTNYVPQAPWRLHTVQYGETLAAIAIQYGVAIDAIAVANGLANPNLIYIGQVLNIPAPVPPPAGFQHYIVNFGDALSLIAQRFNVTVESIMSANGLVNPNTIFPGQLLRIPNVPINPPPTRTYTVRQGDTLSYIAQLFGVTVQAIMQANNLANDWLIYPGQVLIIPGSQPPGDTVSYLVQVGDNILSVAARFNTTVETLAALNNLKPPYALTPGQVIRVPNSQSNYLTYTVPPQGEPFFMIAQRFKVTQEALAAANNMQPPYTTYPGQVLRIPTTTSGRTHTVQSGENILSIMFRYNVSLQALATLNNLKPPYALTPGQVLRIP